MTDKPTLLLEQHLKELRLPRLSPGIQEDGRTVRRRKCDHSAYLLRLAELELIDRHQRMVERRIRAARFPAVKSLDTFDFLAIPSVNKALVMELARCEYTQRRENVIAVGNSGTGKTHIALGLGLAACQRGMSVGFTTAAGLVHGTDGGPGRETAAEFTETAFPAQPADHRRAGLRAPVSYRCRTALRDIQPALRAGLHPDHHQPALRRMDRGVRLRTSHRSAAGPAHHHVHILEMNGESYRLKRSRKNAVPQAPGGPGRRLTRSTPQSAHNL